MSDNTPEATDVTPSTDVAELIRPHFDAEFYLRVNPDVAASNADPLEHFINFGAAELRDPGASFSTARYVQRHPEIVETGLNPLLHYVLFKEDEALLERFFDANFYRERNPDVTGSDDDLLHHYLSHGAAERRDPAPWFSTVAHQGAPADSAVNPFLHYLKTNTDEAEKKKTEASLASKLSPSPQDAGGATNSTKKDRPPLQPYYSLAPQSTRGDRVVYTAVFGEKHMLHHNTTFHEQQIVFSDNALGMNNWQHRPPLYWDANPKLAVLFHKYQIVNFFPLETRVIWVDSRVSVQTTILDEIFASLEDHDLCLFRHYERNCVYQEIDGVLVGKRAPEALCSEYRDFLTSIDFPRDCGLYETGALGFRVTPHLRQMFSMVWGLCWRYIHRDQLTLPVALRSSPVRVRTIRDGQSHLRNTPGVFVHSW